MQTFQLTCSIYSDFETRSVLRSSLMLLTKNIIIKICSLICVLQYDPISFFTVCSTVKAVVGKGCLLRSTHQRIHTHAGPVEGDAPGAAQLEVLVCRLSQGASVSPVLCQLVAHHQQPHLPRQRHAERKQPTRFARTISTNSSLQASTVTYCQRNKTQRSEFKDEDTIIIYDGYDDSIVRIPSNAIDNSLY